jgi:hypothetical protein
LKKAMTIGLVAAAMIAGVASLVKVDTAKDGGMSAPAAIITEAAAAESEAPPVVLRNSTVKLAQLAVSQPLFDYERGPRIIHVPQPNERVASRPAVDNDDDDDSSPPRMRAVTPKPRIVAPKPRAVAPPADRTPRWKLRSEAASAPTPPPVARRAVLSAPPPNADGPTPLRPTPRFDNMAADSGQKFASPRTPAAAAPPVTESQPPLGYSPPVTPLPQPPEETSAAPVAAEVETLPAD